MIKTIIASLCLIWLTISIYVLSRNERVYQFRKWLLDRIAASGNYKLIDEYESVSYDRMLFSFKPLKVKYWYSKEFCDKIM